MSTADWLFAFEFGGAFLALLAFGWWQLRSLDKEDARAAEEAERKEREESERRIY
ncbi:MAG: hypothetical protein AAGK38_11220 [Pseudomonadota bacterium]